MERNSPYDFTRMRRALVAEFGKETILRLHRPSALLDGLTIVASWALLLLFVFLLGTRAPLSPLWLAVFVLQGFLIMAFGYILHDLFVHRRVGGKRFGRWMGLFCGLVANLRHTIYAETHRQHHVYTGTDPDEEYKDDIDTRWKRALYLTMVGYAMAFRRRFRSERPPAHPAPPQAFAPIAGEKRRRARVERRIKAALGVALAASAVFWPTWVLFGYVLPLVVILPVANAVRLVLEHAETDVGNRYHCATYYRTGPLTRLLFFWDAGDCHLVHHIFPNIPFYRMGEAVDLFRPFLLRQGVRERRSLLRLLYGYFVRNERHRALWST